MIIAVAGCVAQAEGAEILRRAPDVDIVLGPQTYHRLPEMVARAARARGAKDGRPPRRRRARHRVSRRNRSSTICRRPRRTRPSPPSSSVQEGCDKFCTFCVVPYTRGAEFSRPVGADRRRGAARWWPPARARSRCSARTSMPITAQRRDGGPSWGLGRLIRAPGRASMGLLRIRYTTSHPRDMDDDLIAAHARRAAADAVPASAGAVGLRPHARGDEPPAQRRRLSARSSSGCAPRGRTWRCRRISSSASRARARRISPPPWRWCEEIGFAQAYLLQVQHRAPARPARVDGEPGARSREGRAAAAPAGAAATRSRCDFNRAMIGRVLPVLLEKPGKRAGQLVGRSPYLQAGACRWPAASEIGRVVDLAHRRDRPFQPVGQPRRRLQRRAPRSNPRPCKRPLLELSSASVTSPRRSICSSTTTGCCRCCSASTTSIWRGIEQRARRLHGLARQPARRSPAPRTASPTARQILTGALSAAEARPGRRQARRRCRHPPVAAGDAGADDGAEPNLFGAGSLGDGTVDHAPRSA